MLLELGTGRHLYDPAHKTTQEMAATLSRQERRRVQRRVRAVLKAGYDEPSQQARWGAATYSKADLERATGAADPAARGWAL